MNIAGIAISRTKPQIRMSFKPADRRKPGKDVERMGSGDMTVFQKLKDRTGE
jgi:hypothetical protein